MASNDDDLVVYSYYTQQETRRNYSLKSSFVWVKLIVRGQVDIRLFKTT